MDSNLLLSRRFMEAHPVDAARILERLPVEDTADFLREMPSPLSASVLGRMTAATAAACLEGMSPRRAAPVIAELPLGRASLLLRRLDERTKETILGFLPSETARPLRSLLGFPEGTAGALMDPLVWTLFGDNCVKDALKQMRRESEHLIYYVYVLTKDQAYLGYTTLRELMLAESNVPISSIMHTDMGHLAPRLKRSAILHHPDWHRFHALPVVDAKGVFLGALGYRTLRRLEHEENRDRRTESPKEAGAALAELYRIGVNGLLKWITFTAGTSTEGEK